MDAFYSTSSSSSGPYGAAAYGGAGWGHDSLKDFRQITPAVQTHLMLVRPAALPFALLLLLLLVVRACVRFPLVVPALRRCFSASSPV